MDININVDDRIVLTGNFEAPQIPGVDVAQFFVNGADTRTTGLDVVLTYNKRTDNGRFSAGFTGNFNDMEIASINNGNLDQDVFFGPRDQAFLLASAPDSKMSLNLGYYWEKFDISAAATRFSEIVLVDFAGTDDVYSTKTIFDLNAGLNISKSVRLNVGGNNIFNVYPDQQNDGETDSGGYWDSVQMDFGGAYYYAKLAFTF